MTDSPVKKVKTEDNSGLGQLRKVINDFIKIVLQNSG